MSKSKIIIVEDSEAFYKVKAEKAARQDKLIVDIIAGRVDEQVWSNNSCFPVEDIENAKPSFGRKKDD